MARSVLPMILATMVLGLGPVGAQSFGFPSFPTTNGLAVNSAFHQPVSGVTGVIVFPTFAPALLQNGAGTVFNQQRYPVAWGFDTEVQFRIGTPNFGSSPGDGMSFIIHGDVSGPTALGGPGLAYDGIPNSLVIEIDCRQDFTNGDTAENTISVHTNATGPNCGRKSFDRFGDPVGKPRRRRLPNVAHPV